MASPLGGFHHLVDDSLVLASVSDSEAFKLADELMVADRTATVVVNSIPEGVNLSD